MAFEYKRIDVDSHCQEKPDAWTSRMSKAKWGDRIPQIVEKDGREIWMCDGRVMMNGWVSVSWRDSRPKKPAHALARRAVDSLHGGRADASNGPRRRICSGAFPQHRWVGGEAFMMRMDPE